MQNYIIPTSVIDGFFEDPYKVREFALVQNFSPDPNKMWPGTRSDLLININANLHYYTIFKFLSIYYPIADIKNYFAKAYFQKVNKDFKSGWVHKDNDIITGIVYLNPDGDENSGTSICEPKVPGTQLINGEEKRKFIADPKNYKGDINTLRQQNNNQFTDSIIIKNKFNRLLSFDSHLYHTANEYVGEDTTERLTLVFFISRLDVPVYSMQRLRQTI